MNRSIAMPLRAAFIASLLALLTGCDTAAYYLQAIRGQTEMWQATRPIEEVLSDTESPQTLRDRLTHAMRIRQFATSELSLPENQTYRGYADLKRPYVVWNLFATEPFSIKPRQWCFPIAGCVAYRGYFSRAEAEAAAESLRRKGEDVFLGGVPAYSTLGYFNDPVLNTFIHYPQAELARLIFHELAHQVVYAKGDTAFNESFATAVEREGVRRWMQAHGNPKEREAFERGQERRVLFRELVSRYRDRLEELYASNLSPSEMAERKKTVFSDLHAEYDALKEAWGGFSGYDRWLGTGANNASLASVSLYTQLVPAFQALLARLDHDLPRFYAEVKRLAELPQEERHARLEALSNTAQGEHTAIR